MSLIKIYITDEVVVVSITAGIVQILSPSPCYYRCFYRHSYGKTTVIVIGIVTVVLPPSPSSCHSFMILQLLLDCYGLFSHLPWLLSSSANREIG